MYIFLTNNVVCKAYVLKTFLRSLNYKERAISIEPGLNMSKSQKNDKLGTKNNNTKTR
jgi:hypothetical protein